MLLLPLPLGSHNMCDCTLLLDCAMVMCRCVSVCKCVYVCVAALRGCVACTFKKIKSSDLHDGSIHCEVDEHDLLKNSDSFFLKKSIVCTLECAAQHLSVLSARPRTV